MNVIDSPPQSIVSSWVCKIELYYSPKLGKRLCSHCLFPYSQQLLDFIFIRWIFEGIFGRQTIKHNLWPDNYDMKCKYGQSCRHQLEIDYIFSIFGWAIFGCQPSEDKTIKFDCEFMMIGALRHPYKFFNKPLAHTVKFQCCGYMWLQCGHVPMPFLKNVSHGNNINNSVTI